MVSLALSVVHALVDPILDGYDTIFHKWADPRTNDLFLMSSPLPGLFLLFLYLRFVNVWGPNFMKDRKPYNLDNLLIVYNLFNVLISGYLFKEAVFAAWGNNYSFACEPVDTSNNPQAIRIMNDCHLYFLVKILELLDTVFFILRKKFNQASFLHIYHHTGMVMLAWGATRYLPGGHGTFLGLLNTFVHIVMYSYYLMTALWPQYKNSIWWKKHITQMQMAQFFLIIVHALQLPFRDCGYPAWTIIVTVPNNLVMFILFYDFYCKAYGSKSAVEESNKTIANGSTPSPVKKQTKQS